MRVFQIGFNKCATTALYSLFMSSGVPSIHSSGRFWRLRDHPAVSQRNVQETIHNNIQSGQDPLKGLEEFRAFFDMEFIKTGKGIENYRQFRLFSETYPTAKFILNHRDKASWLRSRARHNDGTYLHLAMDRTGYSREGVFSMWSDDYDAHHQAVRDYFADKPGRLLEFDIDRSDIEDLVAFVAPKYRLKAPHWKRVRVTDHVALVRRWKDVEASHAA